MALSKTRLKARFVEILTAEATNNQLNPSDHAPILAAIDRIADGFASAVVDEIKETKVIYTTGLATPPGGGAVTGTLNHTIQ